MDDFYLAFCCYNVEIQFTLSLDVMMNKKLLICGAIATGLLLTACVKKEAPKEEEQVEVSAASENTPEAPVQFETLEPTEQVESTETIENQREIQDTNVSPSVEVTREVTTPAAPAVTKVPAVEKPAATYTPKTNTSSAQSEDDAVADAIAAATPALDN